MKISKDDPFGMLVAVHGVSATSSKPLLVKAVGKASDALAISYQELQTAIPARIMVNIDEMGHPENGKTP